VWLGGRCSGCLNDSLARSFLFFFKFIVSLGYSSTWKECIWLEIEHTSADGHRYRHISFLSSFVLPVNTRVRQVGGSRSSLRVDRRLENVKEHGETGISALLPAATHQYSNTANHGALADMRIYYGTVRFSLHYTVQITELDS
jgi:hypothetical protein